MRQEGSSESFLVGQVFRAQRGKAYRVPGEEGAGGPWAWCGMSVSGGPEELGSHQPGLPPEDPQAGLACALRAKGWGRG